MTTENFTQHLHQLTGAVARYQSRFPSEIGELFALEQDVAAKLARFAEDSQRLSIGIIGQVKAGKSSFLNALLFDGQPVLPEAATPKTANLTRITHGAAPALVVHYYAPEAWAQLQALAAGGGQHAEARVARELVDMVKQAGVDADAVLAKGVEHLQAPDVAGLIGLLNDYVGANGRYTALVEATELQLPLAELQGFEVVDTPGMNDPVASRTQKTRDFMARCDVVFFLSRCSQFLDQSDMDLLAGQLPSKGVKRLILVGCQFDGAILDDGFDRASLAATEANLSARLSRHAGAQLERLAKVREQQGAPDVAALLRQIKIPLFASSYAHGFAAWPAERWSQGMTHAHGELTELAADSWNGYEISAGDWRRIGNFQALTAAYNVARADKAALLAAQRDGLLPENRRRLQEALARLAEAAENRRQQLQGGDISQLAVRQAAAEQRMAGIVGVLTETVNQNREQARLKQRELAAELQAAMAEAAKLDARTGTDTVERSHKVSTSKWWNPFSWGSSRTVYYTETVSYRYLAAADAIENLNQYALDNNAALQREFSRIINPAQLRAELKRVLLKELDTASENFDPKQFRTTLEGSLERLRLPELCLPLGDVGRAIGARFSGEVRDDKAMTELREALRQALQIVSGQLDTAFKNGVDELCQQLDQVKAALADELVKDIHTELEQLRTAFADKERELAHYDEVLAVARDHEGVKLD